MGTDFADCLTKKYYNLLNPIRSVHQKEYTLEVEQLASLLQVAIVALLRRFLNGETLTRTSMALYPLANAHRGIPRDFCELVRYSHRNRINLPDSVAIIDRMTRRHTLGPNDYARLISTLYREFYSYLSSCEFQTKCTTAQVSLDYLEWRKNIKDEQHLKPALELGQRLGGLASCIKGFYFHGSVASLDYVTNWSDLDDLIIVNGDTVLSATELARFQDHIFQTKSFLYSFDPIQHHGHGFIAEQDMSFYPQILFPLVVFENAVCCFGPNELLFHLRSDKFEKQRSIVEILVNLHRISKHELLRPFALKAYISLIMLLPSLYLQMKNIYCSKKYSFAKAKADFGSDWEAVSISTDMRNQWSTKVYNRRLKAFLCELPNPHALMLFHYVFNRVPSTMGKTVDDLVVASSRFTKRLIHNLETDGCLRAY